MNQLPSTALVLVGKNMLIRVAAFIAVFLLVFAPVVQVFAQEASSATAEAVSVVDTGKEVPSSGTTGPVDHPILPPAPKDEDGDVTPVDTDTPPVIDPIVTGPVISGGPLPDDGGKDPDGNNTLVTFTQPFNPENLTAGLTAANHKAAEVDESTGALTYSYPITIPPGRNGLQPNLALEYNNQQAANNPNIYGYGWTLSIPYIDRLNKTGVDKLYTANYFSSSLSGELVEISTGVYSPKVENGSFIKYEYDGTMWTLTDKQGTVYKFGTNDTERQDDSSHTNTYKWMLEEVRDTNDNYIAYTYTKDNGQIYPDTITYTGNDTTPGIFEVIFHTTSRSDAATSYATGFLVETNYLIEQIEVSVSSDWVRKYDLDFIAGDNGNRSLLGSIIETGRDSTQTITTPLDPISFTYSTSTPNWTLDTTNYDAPMAFGNGYQSMLDFNGDAWPDVIESWYDNGSANGAETSLNDTHNYWNPLSGLLSPIYFRLRETRGGSHSDTWEQGVRIGDVNGDLLPDMIKAEDNGNSLGGVDAYINTSATSWTQDSNWYPTATFNGDDNITTWGSHFIDLNGDGLTDIIRKGGASQAQINTGTGFDSVTTAWAPPVDLFGPMSQFADVNNDGLPDIIYMGWVNPNQIKSVYLNGGDGTWIQDNSWIPPVDTTGNTNNNDYGVRFFDMNGDGLVDEVPEYDYSYAGQHTQLNTGNGWVQAASGWDVQNAPTNPAMIDFTNVPISIVDVNADGSLDFFTTQNSGAYTTYAFLNNTHTPPDLLTGIEFPETGTTDITYKRSTQYRDGSGDILNLNLPIPLDTVNTITTTDPISSVSGTTTYSYEGGKYYYNTYLDRKFAGFHVVTKTDDHGNVTKTYFHQGDGDDTASGEDYGGSSNDTPAKIGKAYRIERNDDSNNYYEVTVMKWTEDQILSSDAYFVHQDAKTTMSYNGDNTHRDIMQTFSYNTGTGNLEEKIELGEVTANDDGSLNTDVGTDDRTTQYEYAAPVGSFNVIGLPSHETVMENGGGPIKETQYYYDGQSLGDVDVGNLTLIEKNTDGSVWSTITKAYTPWGGLVESETDPNSHTTTYSYDTYSLYPEVTTDALSWNVTRYYDYATGKVTETTDKNSNVWTTTYDGFGRKLTEVIPMSGGQVTRTEYVYDDSSSQKSIMRTDHLSSSLSHATYTYLDGFGRAIQIRSEAESDYDVADTIYNGLGQIASQSLPYNDSGTAYTAPGAPAGIVTSYTYDPLGRIKSETHTSLGSTDYVYDDWQVSVTDRNGHEKVYYTDAYDNLVQVDEHSDVSTYETHYEWNMLGKLTKITDAENNIRNFTYDWVGNRLSAEDLHYYTGDTDFGTWNYVYDLAGNMTQSTDPRGMQIDYQYDELNRVLYENDPNVSGLEVEYVYDTACANGYDHLCIATGLNGVITEYSYFPEGTVETEAVTVPSTQYLTTYTYDYQGNVESIVYPNSDTVSYVYNTAGLLESIDHTPNGGSSSPIISDINYAPHGAIADETYGNAIITTNTYDNAKLYRLSHKVTTDSSTNLYQDISYGYDNVGNILSLDDASNSNALKEADYLYDDLDRLMSATITNTPNSGSAVDYTDTFTYTGIGNFEGMNLISYAYGGTASGNYANPHAPTIIDTDTYTYDEAGNLLDDSNNTYSWTYRNELAQATTPSGTIDYLYNHTGNRVQTNDTVDVIDTPNKYYETNGASPTDYIYANSQLVANIDGNGTHYVHADHLTGSSVITDTYPKQEQLLDYYPYGGIRLNEMVGAFDEAKKFTGYRFDNDTGLNYAGARYYHAERGQFISQDPVFWAIGDESRVKESSRQEQNKILMNPQALNSYSYAGDNPLNNIDPDGKMFGIDDLAGFGLGAIAGVTTQTITSLVITGDFPTWSEVGGAAVTGGILGWGAVNTPATLGASGAFAVSVTTGFTAGLAGDYTKQKIDIATGNQTGGINNNELMNSALFTGATNGVLSVTVPDARIPGITVGQGNMNAVGAAMRTKGANGTISTISASTAIKSAIGSQAVDLYRKTAEGVIDFMESGFNKTNEK